MEETNNRKRQSLGALLGKAITLLLIVALPAVAQQQQAPADTTQAGQSKADDKKKADQKEQPDQPSETTQSGTSQSGVTPSGTSKDRLFYTLPNFLTVQSTQLPPLTTGEKFKVVARGSFDYVEYPWYAALAGIGQAQNSEAGYGQGAAGYGKRYGASFGDGTIENFLTGAVLPSLLREDPRYYQSGTGSFWRRTGYAISRIFVTPTDAGGRQFNVSEIVGSALSAGISTYSYHPHSDRTLSNTASVWGSQIGYDTITFVVKEFWPDIHRKISRKRHPDPTTP